MPPSRLLYLFDNLLCWFRYMLQLTCSDGIQDGDESDIDCGGQCYKCGPGLRCFASRDCLHGECKKHDKTCSGHKVGGIQHHQLPLFSTVKRHHHHKAKPKPKLPPSMYHVGNYVQVNYQNRNEWFAGNIIKKFYTGSAYTYDVKFNDRSTLASIPEQQLASGTGMKHNKDGPLRLKKRAYKFFGQTYTTSKPVAAPTYSPTKPVTKAPTVATDSPTRNPTHHPTARMQCRNSHECTVCAQAAHKCCVDEDNADGWECAECAKRQGCFNTLHPTPLSAPLPTPRPLFTRPSIIQSSSSNSGKKKHHQSCKPGKYKKKVYGVAECWACPDGKFSLAWDAELCVAGGGKHMQDGY